MDALRIQFRERLATLYGRVTPGGKGTFHLARWARESRPAGRRTGRFAIDGSMLDLDLDVYPDVAMAYGLYELNTLRTIRSLLRAGDRVLDVGANIGYVTLVASRIVGPTGHVDAIEPEPHNRARLLNHVAINGASNVTVHADAASDRTGTATIHMPVPGGPFNHGTSSFFPVGQQTEPTEVPTARLDELITGPTPRLIKMDIEGAEPLAIAGMAKLLDVAAPPLMVAEFNGETAGRAGFAADEWLRRTLAIQPRYRVWEISWRLKPLRDPFAALKGVHETNLLLRA